jgi:alpha/beta superfamily hydrolase
VTRHKLRIPAPGGRIETVINDPGPSRKGLALVAHPHPLHGGSMDNKVVQTVADALFDLDYVAVRPNFRGVGRSEGRYDHGRGEVEDMLAIAAFVSARYPSLPWVLVGFSFGAYVQSRVRQRLAAKRLVLIAPAVNMFEFGAVPPDSLVIHGEQDELAPLSDIRAWADPQGLEVAVVPGASHFFHHKLAQLEDTMKGLCRC